MVYYFIMASEIKVKISRFPDPDYMETFYAIEGNTFPIKEYLKHIGCQWAPGPKVWYFKAENEQKLGEMIEKIKSIPTISNVEVDIKPIPQVQIAYSSFEDLIQKAEFGKCIICGKNMQYGYTLNVFKKTNTYLDDTYQAAIITICDDHAKNGEELLYVIAKLKKILNMGVNRIERFNYADDWLKNKVKEDNLSYLQWLQSKLSQLRRR